MITEFYHPRIVAALTLSKENKIALVFFCFFRKSSLSNILNLHLNVHNFHSDRYWEKSILFCTLT